MKWSNKLVVCIHRPTSNIIVHDQVTGTNLRRLIFVDANCLLESSILMREHNDVLRGRMSRCYAFMRACETRSLTGVISRVRTTGCASRQKKGVTFLHRKEQAVHTGEIFVKNATMEYEYEYEIRRNLIVNN